MQMAIPRTGTHTYPGFFITMWTLEKAHVVLPLKVPIRARDLMPPSDSWLGISFIMISRFRLRPLIGTRQERPGIPSDSWLFLNLA